MNYRGFNCYSVSAILLMSMGMINAVATVHSQESTPQEPMSPEPASQQQAATGLTSASAFVAHVQADISLKYLLTLPQSYERSAKTQDDAKGETKVWPLVIFLHGGGERGDDLEKIKKWGIPKLVAEETLPPQLQGAILVSPQCPTDQAWANDLMGEALDQLLADLQNRYAVDATRIYLTGPSMGGFGTWAWAGRHPETFAAIIPICGGGEYFSARDIARAQLPLWCFHGDNDDIVPLEASLSMMRYIRQLGHTGDKARLSVLPNTPHNSWSQAYAQPELWEWLFAQQRTAEAPARKP